MANVVLSDTGAKTRPSATADGDVAVANLLAGDANGDWVVNMADVARVQRIILGLDSPTPGADANRDGVINIGDVTKIERIILGLDPQ